MIFPELEKPKSSHSTGAFRGKGKGGHRGERGWADDLFVYTVTVAAPAQGRGRHPDCQCLVSFGEVAPILSQSRLQ